MTDPRTVALAVLDQIRQGRYTEIRDRFPDGLRPMVTAEALAAAWDGELARLGPVTSVGEPTSGDVRGRATTVTVPLRFARGELNLQVVVAETGELAGLQFVPAAQPWQPPPYADPDRFDEQEVAVLDVPGTLSLPRATGACPGLVLLGGSGPNDRDATIGANKPFKDLAWGLASRGVAVLRFDKVTFAHPEQAAAKPAFTLADEYLPHAVAAVRLLGEHAERVFLAGHSLGGTVAPRVAVAEPAVAGLVLLAAGAEPVHWSAVRQIRYLASLDPATAAAAQPGIDLLTAQAERVDSPDLGPDTPADQLPFGAPSAYWLDLRDYDAVGTAAGLDLPILLCQGERDYQVTVTGDLARWQDGLAGRPDVTVRRYPADNHFFLPGEGPSHPGELAVAGHVDPQVVTDVGGWLTR